MGFGAGTGHWPPQTVVGTTGGATITYAAQTGNKHFVSGIQASGDAAALVTIESPAATILWKKRFSAAFTMSESFAPRTMMGANDSAIVVKVSASTSNSEVNAQGYTVPN